MSHRPANEVKELRRSETTADQRALDAIERQWPDSLAKRAAQRELEILRNDLVARLRPLIDAVRAEKKTPTEAVKAAETVFSEIYLDAMLLGLVVGGAPEWELTKRQREELARLIQDELGFFRNFVKLVALQTRRHAPTPENAARDSFRATAIEMSDQDRLDLYGGGTDDAFWRGWVAALPSSARIHWRLSIAEHCNSPSPGGSAQAPGGCLGLAARSPYAKPGRRNPLRTVPRAGHSRCLGNCRCFLETEIPGGAGGGLWTGLTNRIEVEVTQIEGLKVDPKSPAALGAAVLYRELVERYAYYLRLDVLVPDMGHDRTASALLTQIEGMARRMRQNVRLAVTRAEILGPVRVAQALIKSGDWRFIGPPPPTFAGGGADFDDELLLALAVVLGMNDPPVDRGVITAVQHNPPRVTLDDDPDRVYQIGSSGVGAGSTDWLNLLFIIEE